jgi:DNA-binding MarR family transcriptional regulator
MTDARQEMNDRPTGDASKRLPDRRLGPMRDLTSMRMIAFFRILRRSAVLSQRRHFQLSEIEWRIMTQVGEFAPLSLNGLAELLLQDRGQLSRAVKGMVERGLLIRERKPGGPEIEIDLAPAGRELHERMVGLVIARDAMLTKDIAENDIQTLRSLIDLMIDRAETLLEEEQRLVSP